MVSGIALIVVGILLFGLLAKCASETDSLQFAIIFAGALGFVLFVLNTFAKAVFLEFDTSSGTSQHSITHEVRTPTSIDHPTYMPTLKPVN